MHCSSYEHFWFPFYADHVATALTSINAAMLEKLIVKNSNMKPREVCHVQGIVSEIWTRAREGSFRTFSLEIFDRLTFVSVGGGSKIKSSTQEVRFGGGEGRGSNFDCTYSGY